MYTEAPNSQQLMLVIPQLMETMAGTYRCVASYANSDFLEAEVKVETYGMQSTQKYKNKILEINS